MRLEGVSLRDAIDAAVEEETVYMLIRLTPDLTVMDLYGADGYVVMREEDPQDLEEKFQEILDSVDEQKPMPAKKVSGMLSTKAQGHDTTRNSRAR